MDEKILTALLLAFFVIVLFTVAARAWLVRVRQDEEGGDLPSIPEDLESREPLAVIIGMYVATCEHQKHLQRLMAHGLGVRTRVTVFIYPDGILYDRDGAAPIWVSTHVLVGFGTTSGMVGKFVERDGIIVVSWRWRNEIVDTGMRTQTHEGKRLFLQELNSITSDSLSTPSMKERL